MRLRLLILLTAIFFFSNNLFSQVPVFNSLPGSGYVVFLDFDGHTVTGSSWNTIYNSGNPIVCAASGYDAVKTEQVFNIVAEDYRPFNVNVTTDSTVFNAAPPLQKVRVIITPTQSWYPASAGVVAYLNSFSSPSNNMCFAFVGSLAYNGAYTAEASSHEAGHTLGLNHHSDYNSSCTKVGEYLNGYGSGEIGWAPIMGVGYYKNQTTWSNIASNFSCSYPQSDLGIITSAGNRGVAFRTDDHGNDNTAASMLTFSAGAFSDSGIITNPADIDVFKITVTNKSLVTVNANPWNYGIGNNKANLDILLILKDAAGNNILVNNPATLLNASMINILLAPGDYFIYVSGSSNVNQDGYGSIGKYYLTGTAIDATVTTLSANFIADNTNICKVSTANFTDQSTGAITSWNWTFTGGTPATFTGQNPGVITYNTAGLYSVSLTVSDGIATNTKTTASYVKVNNLPSISVTPANPFSCGGAGVLLNATGALTYNWTPATGLSNTFLNNVTASVTADATYTVAGTDANGCTGTKAILVKYFPSPVLTKTPADNKVYYCKTDSLTLNVNGASTYTWSPATGLNTATGPTVKAGSASAGTTFYNVTGTDANGCTANAFFNVTARSCDSLAADFSSTGASMCSGDANNFSDFSTGSPSTWKWTFAGGSPSSSTAQNPGLVSYSAAGQYDVSLQIINGTDTSTKVATRYVTVADYPNLVITPAAPTLCLGDSILLTAATAQSYLWDDDITLSNKYSATTKVKPVVTTKYLVTGTNYASGIGGFKACTARDSATVIVTNCSPLPIQLVYFYGLLSSNNTVQLHWQVSSQENIAKFELEKSYDGIHFNRISSIDKNANTGDYEFSDDQLSSNAAILYYRLRSIEKDNTAEVSGIIKIKIADKKIPLITIWPNPVTDGLNVKIISNQNNTAVITLKNIFGQTIIQKEKALTQGNNDLNLPVLNLSAGIYFINVSINSESTILKVIKQ
ncbi:MAG: PKD domain-containing protein [Ferruginibacter sp.]